MNKLDIDGREDLKLTYGIRVLGTTFRKRRENKVILLSFLLFGFFVNFLILVNYFVIGYGKMIKLSHGNPILKKIEKKVGEKNQRDQ